MSEAKREMLDRRRGNPDITDGTMPIGTMDDATRARHGHGGSTFDLRTDAPGSRPGSAQPYGGPHSYSAAVSIYSQRLSRPRSASSSGASRTGRTLVTRPASAAINRPSQQHQQFTTSDPVVDTYNEAAIQEALQRLALRQQARQYSAVNSNSVLKPSDITPSKPPMRPSSASSRLSQNSYVPREAFLAQHPGMSVTGQSQMLHSPGAPYARPQTQNSGRYMMEEQMARGVPPRGPTSRQPSAHMAHQPSYSNLVGKGSSQPLAATGNVHLQNANATFNSFIEDPNPQWQTEIASAYSEVTGVPPQNYHMTSVNSRQFQIAQQQAMKQRMMEQSKAMLEQSKAKHSALVSQAQTSAPPATPPLYPAGADMALDLASGEMTEGQLSARGMLVPKPPEQPAYRRPPVNSSRVNRKPIVDETNLNFNFYNSLMANGQSSQI